MLASFFIRREHVGQGSYGAGQTAGLLFGVVMLGAGIYCLTRIQTNNHEAPQMDTSDIPIADIIEPKQLDQETPRQ